MKIRNGFFPLSLCYVIKESPRIMTYGSTLLTCVARGRLGVAGKDKESCCEPLKACEVVDWRSWWSWNPPRTWQASPGSNGCSLLLATQDQPDTPVLGGIPCPVAFGPGLLPWRGAASALSASSLRWSADRHLGTSALWCAPYLEVWASKSARWRFRSASRSRQWRRNWDGKIPSPRRPEWKPVDKSGPAFKFGAIEIVIVPFRQRKH